MDAPNTKSIKNIIKKTNKDVQELKKPLKADESGWQVDRSLKAEDGS